MQVVVAARTDLDRQNVSGNARSKGQLAGRADCAVLSHEEASAAGHTLEGYKDAAATSELRVGGHLDGGAHPREFSCFGDDRLVGIKREFEDGHGGADDAVLHYVLLTQSVYEGSGVWVQ